MANNGDNISMVDIRRIEEKLGQMEKSMEARLGEFQGAIKVLTDLVSPLREALDWVAKEKALHEIREDQWDKLESRMERLEKRAEELRDDAIRQREKDRIASWVFGLVIAIGSSVLASAITSGLRGK